MLWQPKSSAARDDMFKGHTAAADQTKWPMLSWAADCAVLPFGLSVCMAGLMPHLTITKLPIAFLLILFIALLPPRPLALPASIQRRRQLRNDVLLGLWSHGWRLASGLGSAVLLVAFAIWLILNGQAMVLNMLPPPDRLEPAASMALVTAIGLAWPALIALFTVWILLLVGRSWLRTFNRPLIAWTGLWLRPERRSAAMHAWIEGQHVFLALSSIPLGLWLLQDLGLATTLHSQEAGWLLVVAQLVRLHLFRQRAPVPASVTLRRWPGRPWRLTLSLLLTLAGLLFSFADPNHPAMKSPENNGPNRSQVVQNLDNAF